MTTSKLHTWIAEWVEQLDKNKKCPYAKPVVDKDKMKAVMVSNQDAYNFWSSVSKEAERFDDIIVKEKDNSRTISLEKKFINYENKSKSILDPRL